MKVSGRNDDSNDGGIDWVKCLLNFIGGIIGAAVFILFAK